MGDEWGRGGGPDALWIGLGEQFFPGARLSPIREHGRIAARRSLAPCDGLCNGGAVRR